jgi:hypothetical protein
METDLLIGGADHMEYPEYTEVVTAIIAAAYDTGSPFDVPFEFPSVLVPLIERPNPKYTTDCSTKDAPCGWLEWHHCPLKAQILTHLIEVRTPACSAI